MLQFAFPTPTYERFVAELRSNSYVFQTGFRHAFSDSRDVYFITWASGPDYGTFLSFNYRICDPNATCDQTSGSCTCNFGYSGSGATCTGTHVN